MMSNLQEKCSFLGISIPSVLLPQKDEMFPVWSVVACDQFSSEREYWDKVEEIVGDAPSTLRLILPEAYLENGDTEERIAAINGTMKEYLEKDVLAPLPPGFILVERTTPHVASRKGLLLAVDLERYSFNEGSRALIRPTEGTILRRLPPRMDIRRGACLDLPHILFLVNDPGKTLIEPLYENRENLDEVYGFELMQGGGTLRGWHVPEDRLLPVLEALEKLIQGDLLFAVGDGNHSLAAAKQLWEEKKTAGAPENSPARYALVEVENIFDPGVVFHPIHRVLFDVDGDHLFQFLTNQLGTEAEYGAPEAEPFREGTHTLGFILGNKRGKLRFFSEGSKLTVELLQEVLDLYLEQHQDVSIDYIHGEDSVTELCLKDSNMGFILPPVDKGVFFSRILAEQVYPRKTFSIGEAVEKRYYLEARKLMD